MSELTAVEAIGLLNSNPENYSTVQALRDLANCVSVYSEGKVTVLYSGGNGSVVGGGDIVKGMIEQGDDVRAISRTAVYQFLDSPAFLAAAAKAFDAAGTPTTIANIREHRGQAAPIR